MYCAVAHAAILLVVGGTLLDGLKYRHEPLACIEARLLIARVFCNAADDEVGRGQRIPNCKTTQHNFMKQLNHRDNL